MFCSIVIPTIARPTLEKAVRSALEQAFDADDYEIIIVNDSGKALPSADWQNVPCVRILNTQKRERSVARNTGAAVALGKYLYFLDDDDWLLPDALNNLWALVQQSPEAAWLYGGVIFVDHTGNPLGYLNIGKNGNCFVEAMAETWIPLQVSLIKSKAFFEVGGFDPFLSITEDLDLLRRITLKRDVAFTITNVACMVRATNRSSTSDKSHALKSIRLSRDRLLDEPGAWGRLRESAKDSSFLHGLALRIYLVGIRYNFLRGAWVKAFSRTIYLLLSLLLAFRQAFAKNFWKAVFRPVPYYYESIRNISIDYKSVSELF